MTSTDTWLMEFEKAILLAEDVSFKLRERDALVSSGGNLAHLVSSTRRKITELGTLLDRLESLLQNPPEKPKLTEEELQRRWDMLLDVRMRTKQIAASFSTSPSKRTNQEENTDNKNTDTPQSSGTDHPATRLLSNQGARTDVVISIPDQRCENSLTSPLIDNDRKEANQCCTPQLGCLICLGVLALFLFVWTIFIRIR